MGDIRTERVADVLVNYSLKVKKGDRVVILGNNYSQPLVKEIYRLALRRGAFVDVYADLPEMDSVFFEEAGTEQLLWTSERAKIIYGKYNKLMVVRGEDNTRGLTGVSSRKMKEWIRSRRAIREAFYKRVAAGKASWCATYFPTAASAQEASMSLEEYERFYYRACLCDKPGAVAKWKRISRRQARLASRLNRVKEIRIQAPDTDLKARVAGRRWVNCDGTLNFPDGEVFTGPIETSVNGHIRYSFPAIHLGKEVEDIFLEFKNGKVAKATAAKGEDLLKEMIKADKGASYVGELAIGTNYGIDRFVRNILFDEKIGGTIHLALGMAFSETGSKNRSAIHWDMISDMKRGKIFADGKLIYKDGRFASGVF